MYNKLFTKILDSSIWLAPTETRIVWITMLAAMDEDGFVQMATVANVARRANVEERDAADAIERLESPEHGVVGCPYDGRRIERVPGGWMVLKAKEYADIVRRVEMKALNRERVRRHRERVTGQGGNAPVTSANDCVMQSDTDTDTDECTPLPPKGGELARVVSDAFDRFWSLYPKKVGKGAARVAWTKAKPGEALVTRILAGVERQSRSAQWLREGGRFIPNPATWLHQQRWDDQPDPEVPQLSEKTIRILSAGKEFLASD